MVWVNSVIAVAMFEWITDSPCVLCFSGAEPTQHDRRELDSRAASRVTYLTQHPHDTGQRKATHPLALSRREFATVGVPQLAIGGGESSIHRGKDRTVRAAYLSRGETTKRIAKLMRRIKSPGLTFLLSLFILINAELRAFGGITFVAGQGLVLTGADGLVLTGADGLVLTGADGLVLTGADGLVLTGADGLVLTGADAVTYTGTDGLVLTGADSSGLRSLDPELAVLLNRLPDSSAINVFVVFHQMPTDADLDALRAAGVVGGTRFHNLPMVLINARKDQVAAISALPSVRSLYSNKTFEFFTHDSREITGQSAVAADATLTARNQGLPVSGRGVTVAVLDTGIDATHPDLASGAQVVGNVRTLDFQGSAPDFTYPAVVEGLVDSDLTMGHGTFVAGVIAGNGTASGGYYGGLAPGARMLGISAGDASLFYVLSGIDYILSQRVDKNIRVVNCSFGISGVFDVHDPVNIATMIMHDAGISVVFSAGNRGDQPNSLNPYSVAEWVIGVGSGTKDRKLSSFSSRGAAGYGAYYPTLIAPGENIVSTRSAGVNVVGTAGLAGALSSQENDVANIAPANLPRYTMSSGTSFAAPHVAATIALMLEAAPQLTPDQIKRILQSAATPMLGYSRYEVGAGYLNTYAAVRKAATNARFGNFRSGLNAQGVSYSRSWLAGFSGEVAAGATYTTTFQMPQDSVFSTVQVAWVNAGAVGANLSVTLAGAAQTLNSKPAALLAGQSVQKTGVTLNDPGAGSWTITVRNTGSTTGAPQRFVGAIETLCARYSNVSDITQFSAADQQTIKRAMRTGLVVSRSGGFGPNVGVTRLDVARAVMLGAGAFVPQYLPAQPTFADVPADDNSVFVESVVNSPSGNLIGATGLYFNPQGACDRLTVAIAVVKALGLESQAQAWAGPNPGLSDWAIIPDSARGYIAVALGRNLIRPRANGFRPFDSMTRAELAWTATALQQATR
jgi:serine protease AprX